MKRTKQGVPAAETGRVAGDYTGSRNYNQMPTKGGRNATTDESRRGAGQVAPRPKTSKQPLLSSSSATASTQAGIARVKGAGSSPTGTSGPAGSFTPVENNANANQHGTPASYGGKGTPPAQRGGPAGLRAGGRNQTWPNGPMYTDSSKKDGAKGRGGEFQKPKRRGLGAAFYGEYT
jgi:hypothetical protein